MPRAVRLGDVAYDSLRRLITQELPPGTRLSEVELASRLGMSKTPVRDALRQLQSEGYIEAIPHVGYLIPHISYRDVREVFEIRQALEGEAASLAAVRLDQAVLDELVARLASVRADPDGADGDEASRLTGFGSMLHDHVLAGADNGRMVKLLSSLRGQIDRATAQLLRDAARHRQSFEEHARLLDALVRKDSAAARRAMTDHIRSLGTYVLQRY
jgi:DNA-binding GntR family transcriptional regulator